MILLKDPKYYYFQSYDFIIAISTLINICMLSCFRICILVFITFSHLTTWILHSINWHLDCLCVLRIKVIEYPHKDEIGE